MKKLLCILFLFVAGIAAALEIKNLSCSGITTTSAVFNAEIVSGTNPICTLFHGRTDYSNTTSWAFSSYAITGAIGNVSTQITGLTPGSLYYFTWRAVEGGTTNWATPSSNVWIKIVPPVPPAAKTISLQTDTDGELKAPLNFFVANSNLIKAVVAPGEAQVVYGVSETTAYRGDWGDAVSNAMLSVSATAAEALATANAASATANAASETKLNLAGGVMTGPLTNEHVYYGDGSGLTNLPAGDYVAGTYPVFKLDVGNVDGNWTDFEIKASTNNFETLLYYYRSWTNDTGTNTDSDAAVYFTDDYGTDPRQWNRKTNDVPVSSHLQSEDSRVGFVYFSPSHECNWEGWMSATNTKLVWAWVRVDNLGFEENIAGTKSKWNAVRPESWDVKRITGIPWAELVASPDPSTAETFITWRTNTFDGTNCIYFVSPFNGSNYVIAVP